MIASIILLSVVAALNYAIDCYQQPKNHQPVPLDQLVGTILVIGIGTLVVFGIATMFEMKKGGVPREALVILAVLCVIGICESQDFSHMQAAVAIVINGSLVFGANEFMKEFSFYTQDSRRHEITS